MSINQILEKIKPFYYLLLIIGIASIFFALGRLYGLNSAKEPLKIEYNGQSEPSGLFGTGQVLGVASSTSQSQNSGEVVGSKTGKKYYFPWCGTVKRIKPENLVRFESILEARQAGFLPGGNCKGLK